MYIIGFVSDYDNDSGPNDIVAIIFYVLATTREMIAVLEDVATLLETLFNLLLDYQEVELDIRLWLDFCTDFMKYSWLCMGEAMSVTEEEDEEVLNDINGWMNTLQSFVRILGNSIVDACKIGEDVPDRLAEEWTKQNISTICANVRDIADRYLDDEIDEKAVIEGIWEYLQMYIRAGN